MILAAFSRSATTRRGRFAAKATRGGTGGGHSTTIMIQRGGGDKDSETRGGSRDEDRESDGGLVAARQGRGWQLLRVTVRERRTTR